MVRWCQTARMTSPTSRALALLALLQGGGCHLGPDLARRLGVTDRTLRRDVARLRDLGYGVDGDRGATGGYRLGVGASVPPLVLQPEESVAIAVGLRGAVNGAVGGLGEAALSALTKLEGSLSNEARERIAAISHAVVSLEGKAEVPVETVVAVARAIRERRRLRIRYRRHDGSRTLREVEPHRIVHTAARWYLLAFVPDGQAWRTFRLDRLEPSLPLGARFDQRVIPDDAVQRFTNRAIATAPYAVRCRVVAHAPLQDARRCLGVDVAEATARADGDTDLTFGTDDVDTAAGYLGMSGLRFTILAPAALREAAVRMAERLSAAAANSNRHDIVELDIDSEFPEGSGRPYDSVTVTPICDATHVAEVRPREMSQDTVSTTALGA